MMQELLNSLTYEIFLLRYGDLPLPRHLMFEQGRRQRCYRNIDILPRLYLEICQQPSIIQKLGCDASIVHYYVFFIVGKRRQSDEISAASVQTAESVGSLADVVPETSQSHSDVSLCSDSNLQEFIDNTNTVGYF